MTTVEAVRGRLVNALNTHVLLADGLRNQPRAVLAGGWVRDEARGVAPHDADVWLPNESLGRAFVARFVREAAAKYAADVRVETRGDGRLVNLHVAQLPYAPIQVIWTVPFYGPPDLIGTFDFSVCQAAIYFDPGWENHWGTYFDPDFIPDLEDMRFSYNDRAKSLVGGAKGSLARMFKMWEEGWRPRDPANMVKLMARAAQIAGVGGSGTWAPWVELLSKQEEYEGEAKPAPTPAPTQTSPIFEPDDGSWPMMGRH